MRILSYQAFLKEPPNTVYFSGEKWAFNCMSIKLSNHNHGNWVLVDIDPASMVCANDCSGIWDELDRSLETGASLLISTDETDTDGMYNKEAVYAVLEDCDIRKIIAKLESCIKESASVSHTPTKSRP